MLIQDELRDTFAKINIQGSSLAPLLCKMYYEDEGGSADKLGVHQARARLSILGALAITDATDFQAIFGSGTTAGLYDRFIFAPGPSDWSWNHWWQVPPVASRLPVNVSVKRSHFDRLEAWTAQGKALGINRGRLAEIALRVAVISSSASGERDLTEACVTAAIRFAEWQYRVRLVYGPGMALNQDAQCCSAILDALHEASARSGKLNPVKWRDFVNNKSFNRKFGSSMVTRTRESLINGGHLEAELDDKNKRTGRYALVPEAVSSTAHRG